MTTDRIVHSQRCWINGALEDASVVIQNGLITAIHPGKYNQDARHYLELEDAVLMPGVIDAHVHLNDPGRSHWEGFETGTKAAAFGGTTTVVDMPLNSNPVTTTVQALQAKLVSASGNLNVNCGFWAGAIGQKPKKLRRVINAGCLGVKAFLIDSGIDEFPAVDRQALEMVLPTITESGVPLLVHAELEQENAGSMAFEQQPTHYAAFLASRPKSWENTAIRMLIELCEKYKCRTHIVHLSSAEALPDIANAKAAGLPLTVETCAHYLFFNAEEIPDANPLYKCTPPIRERANNGLLLNAVKDGLIDFITTDHSPAPSKLKALESGDLSKAWGGISSIQFLLSASWTALRKTVNLEQFIPLLTEKPSEFIGVAQRKGQITPGFDADLVAWTPETQFTLKPRDIVYRHKISPYVGQTLFGQVHHTFVSGYQVIADGQFSTGGGGSAILRPIVSK